ncbi:3-hydroxyacyl-CoA dehydrogenase-like protein [Myriangium duriaei CBS 260.36]|uniref:3-hydroxyacyl-CoA dehydrogenase-like protein n=1 Tax=Myriangium duriaei CBS 260.36 TaxID=1168546 RepID=A0A9P4MMS6_9PEZI|nr:3-hydroxyacyl-CoA dehydrogenase-like protein [Myriangium duriaei CBS 260.36]
MPLPGIGSLRSRPVAILGGGVLGRRIACTWAAAGYTVHIRDPSEEQRNAAVHYVEQNIASYAEAISNSRPGNAAAFDELEAAVKNAWLVVEAVPEKLQIKIDTFGDLAKMTTGDCLLASNSSSYKTSEMLEKVNDATKKRIFNTHYMMPPENRIVELMTDGYTDPDIFPFLVDRLEECGMSPIVARKESTGFVFNRVWAAIKRECLTILSEGVSIPEELDKVWLEMFSGGKAGPCAMMDAVGLDTVAFIEEHYIKERGLSPEKTVNFLEKGYISEGKLGAKSGKGGLYPTGYTTKSSKQDAGDHDNIHAPTLYFLDLSLVSGGDPLTAGRIMAMSPGSEPKPIVTGQAMPDGLDISLKQNRIYWTNMGIPDRNDGVVQSCRLDGTDVQTVIKSGDVHTPKQLVIDHDSEKLYFSDREGLRIMRCNLDGGSHEVLVQRGDWNVEADMADQTKWCVGIAIDTSAKKFYWTQKGPSKGGKGRIFRANIDMPLGEDASSRTDIEAVLTGLPEPIDLEITSGKLFWTDRGDPPTGNTINCVELKSLVKVDTKSENAQFNVLAKNLHEAIGLKIDSKNKHVFATDLGGMVYRFDLDGRNKTRIFESELSMFTGIALAYV